MPGVENHPGARPEGRAGQQLQATGSAGPQWEVQLVEGDMLSPLTGTLPPSDLPASATSRDLCKFTLLSSNLWQPASKMTPLAAGNTCVAPSHTERHCLVSPVEYHRGGGAGLLRLVERLLCEGDRPLWGSLCWEDP